MFIWKSKQSTSIPFSPTNFIWKLKASSKVKAFAWLVANKKVNTDDVLKVRGSFKALSPNYCTLCMGNEELIDHLFFTLSNDYGVMAQAF